MLSSTFNSETDSTAYDRGIRALLISLIAICLLFELGTRFGLPRLSRIQERVRSERLDLLASRPDGHGGTKTVAVLGNSLLLWSIDFSLLNKLGAGNFRYSRFVIESTQYWDWYFGLRRLFAEGARPDVVALLIGANHWLEDSIEGEYFAYELLRPSDVVLLRTELNLDRTTASKYFFASWSSWLGSRAIVRKNLLRLIFPDLERFTRKLVGPPTYPNAAIAYDKAVKRMRGLKSVSEENGVKLVVILHPTLDARAPFNPVLAAADAAGVPVIAPVHLEYTSDLYSDGYHLNTAGMEKFTRDLIAPLEQSLHGMKPILAWRFEPEQNLSSTSVLAGSPHPEESFGQSSFRQRSRTGF